jgi:trehalose-phosphatase
VIESAKRIFVSNRLPFGIDKNGKMTRGSGGLVSALLGVSLDKPFTWMGFETNPKTAEILRTRSSEINPHLQCLPVAISKDLYDEYYDGVSNDLIWPLFHYESQFAKFDRKRWDSYRQANQLMADKIVETAKDGDTVWVHDFHFLLVPEMVKQKNPYIAIGFFLHIPFPSIEIFRELPVREEILRSLAHCDLLGFHEYSYLRHFTDCIKAFLGVDSTLSRAQIGEHTLQLGVYPISVDTEALRERACTSKVLELAESYRQQSSPFQILGIDRLDYTKGLELKLFGFQAALRKYPELVGQISLMQVAVPTREKVPIYMKIKKQLDQLVGQINGEFGRPNYVPVQYIYRSINEETLLALYKRADVALITSKRDGMNLVAMEYVIAQDVKTAGVLLLSEFAGAASLLADAISINPWDADMIADSIYAAYKMPQQEKKARMANMQEKLLRYSATSWARNFLTDLDDAIARYLKASRPIPVASEAKQWPPQLKDKLARHKLRLVLDYDGTLVAIQNRPEQAILSDEMRFLLNELQEYMEIYVVSGRNKDFLDSQFNGMSVTLAAEHGAYFKLIGRKWRSRISTNVSSWYPEVQRVMKSYSDRVPFSFVEKKEAALVWHFRESPENFGIHQAKRLDDELKTGLANQPVQVMMGHKIVEAKAVECNKGSFLRWLIQTNPMENYFYICFGDDKTDEDMFQALGENGCTIKIGTELTKAQYRLDNQAQVFPLLMELLKYVKGVTYAERDAHA